MSALAAETREEARARRVAAVEARQQIQRGVPRGLRRYLTAQLERDTDNFSDERRLGAGSFGDVYRGGSPDTGEYAVKNWAVIWPKAPRTHRTTETEPSRTN